jgi:hypothetical protein
MPYQYKTPYGTFVIRPHRSDPTRVELWIKEQKLCCGTYHSAREAAAEVHAHHTGNEQWDVCGLDVPENLDEWLNTPT